MAYASITLFPICCQHAVVRLYFIGATNVHSVFQPAWLLLIYELCLSWLQYLCSLVAHFSSTAAIETERDVASRRNFTICDCIRVNQNHCVLVILHCLLYCQWEESYDGKGYLLYVANSLKKILRFQYMLEHPPNDGIIKSEDLVDISNHWKQHSALSRQSKKWVFFLF